MRILLADRDPGYARQRAVLLREKGAAEVGEVCDLESFRAAVRSRPGRSREWDLVLWDDGIDLHGADREELLEKWSQQHPHIPVVLASEDISMERAMSALRGHAADLVLREAPADELVRTLHRAYDTRLPSPVAASERPTRMLVVGAHPDDVEIGAGGTIHRRWREGWEITVLTLSHGAGGGDPEQRAHEARRAATVLGAELVIRDLPDGRIDDSVSTVRVIEETVRATDPHVVLVHSGHDTHQDHRAVHRATLVAARGIQRVACYQSPSATVDYNPTRFISLSRGDLDAKLAAIRAHGTQSSTRRYLDEDLLRSTARYWSRFTSDEYAEPLELLRDTTPSGPAPHAHA